MAGLEFNLSGLGRGAKKRDYDVIIIGAGAAGLTSAIYTSRARLSTLIIEKGAVGGLAGTTHLIENYPGFDAPIPGPELMDRFKKQAKLMGAEFFTSEVIGVEKGPYIRIKTTDGDFNAKALIIATGTTHKHLNVEGEKEFYGKGVSYCATCDAPLFKDKDVVVVGCGNSGLQEGLFLLKYVKSITFVEFLPYIIAEEILQERIKKYENVSFLLNHEVLSIKGDERLSSVVVRDRKSKDIKEIPSEGVFIYVGLLPQTEVFKGFVNIDKWGYIVVDDFMNSSVEGVYAAGDVRANSVRQVASAVGDGAIAAITAEKYIASMED